MVPTGPTLFGVTSSGMKWYCVRVSVHDDSGVSIGTGWTQRTVSVVRQVGGLMWVEFSDVGKRNGFLKEVVSFSFEPEFVHVGSSHPINYGDLVGY